MKRQRSFPTTRPLKRHRDAYESVKTKLGKKYKAERVVKLQEEEEEGVEKTVSCSDSNDYDALLKLLGNKSVVGRRKQREEKGGRSDRDDEDLESGSESSDEEEEEEDDDDGEKNVEDEDDANPGKAETRTDEDHEYGDMLCDSGESDTEVDYNKSRPSSEALTTSTFEKHLSYKLEPADMILERKWAYTWKTPALGLPNSNWQATGDCFAEDLDMSSFYGLKPRLYKHWLGIYKASSEGSEFEQSKQISFFKICNSYYDILHHNKKPFYLKGEKEDSSVMDAYLMHSLNHVFRSGDLIVKNNRKLAKHEEDVPDADVDAYRDRGFTRPKVLILLPIASIARRIIKRLIKLTPSKNKVEVENLERFYDKFGSVRAKDDVDGAEIPISKKPAKPYDHRALLGDNNEDHFMIGIKFTNRGIKLFGDFYTSDVIVASPLGLVTKIAEEKHADYLSSIEILIVDHADVMLMQNWDHVKKIFVEALNKMPSKRYPTDIMRIRPWYHDEQARFYRQTIILSSHLNPDIYALFNHQCFNYQGKIKLDCTHKGILPKVLSQATQIYDRFETKVEEAHHDRFKYFCEEIFPKIKNSVEGGIMIFISSYLDYLRVRNFLKSQRASVCLLFEYIEPKRISDVRGKFIRGEKKIMLYTERAHFYYRYKIRGVKNLIFYSLPERKEFYPEIVNFLQEPHGTNCTVLYSKLDFFKLERIVGSTLANRMIKSENSVFVIE